MQGEVLFAGRVEGTFMQMTDINDLRAFGKRQKVGRLKREIKQHKQNCWKRQHKMLQLQEVMFEDRR